MTCMSKIALVVGVDAALRVKLARWLAGFEIDSLYVADGTGARALIASVQPDLVILAPGRGTLDLLADLARKAELRHGQGTRVMLCARNRDAELLSVAVAEGADECLIAPFDADILKFKLEQTGILAVQ